MPPVRTQPGYDTEQLEGDLATVRGAHDALSEYAETTTVVVAGTVVAQAPGTTHSLAGDGVPMTQETPHSATLSINGWSGTLRYWLNTNGTVHVSIGNAVAGSPANGATIATLPPGYRPQSLKGTGCGCDTANSNVGSYVTVNASGFVQTTGIAANSTGVYVEFDFPLF